MVDKNYGTLKVESRTKKTHYFGAKFNICVFVPENRDFMQNTGVQIGINIPKLIEGLDFIYVIITIIIKCLNL